MLECLNGETALRSEFRSQTLEPLAEKRVYEPILPVVVEYESVGHEPVYRPFHRRGVKDRCCREKSRGEDFLSAFGG